MWQSERVGKFSNCKNMTPGQKKYIQLQINIDRGKEYKSEFRFDFV